MDVPEACNMTTEEHYTSYQMGALKSVLYQIGNDRLCVCVVAGCANSNAHYTTLRPLRLVITLPLLVEACVRDAQGLRFAKLYCLRSWS